MTSGIYRHYFDEHGERYSHVLDARSGQPVAHDTVSVTVIHANPSQADAWSTALLCLGEKDGVAVAQQHGITSLFITENGNQLNETPTAAWGALKKKNVAVN